MFEYVLDLNNDQIYWLFSSSSQSIAAFIALIFTGYSFVVNVMDNLEARDETLADMHYELKKTYYVRLKSLALIGGSTIILSLLMIFINYYSNWMRSLLLFPSALGIIVTVGIGVWFIIEIVDPNKYAKKAKALLMEEEKAIEKEGYEVGIGEFMTLFIRLEKLIQNVYQDISLPSKVNPNNKQFQRSLSEMASILFKYELLNFDELELLKEVIKTRNLVVHGHQSEIDSSWLHMIRKAIAILQSSLEKVQKIKQRTNIQKLYDKLYHTENILKQQRAHLEDLHDKHESAIHDAIKDNYNQMILQTESKIADLEKAIHRQKGKIEEEESKLED